MDAGNAATRSAGPTRHEFLTGLAANPRMAGFLSIPAPSTAIRSMGEPIPVPAVRLDGARVFTVALATLRRHSASPLAGTVTFWERVAGTVLRAHLADAPPGAPTMERVRQVAHATAHEFAGSPITSSETLWHGIVATVLTEYAAPSGMGNPVPSHDHAHHGFAE